MIQLWWNPTPWWARGASVPAGSSGLSWKEGHSQCREGILQFALLPDSLGRKATDLPIPEGSPTGIKGRLPSWGRRANRESCSILHSTWSSS